jgi:molybdopterin-guanine dinucleotide biosynthesis protein A
MGGAVIGIPPASPAPRWDAVVLAGGSGRRLGGVDKTALQLGGRPVLEWVLAGCTGAGTVVVAGPRRPVPQQYVGKLRWCREDPPGAGPLAGLTAALPLTSAPVVVLLGGDMPFVAGAVPRLLRALTEDVPEVAVLRDSAGRLQVLATAARRTTWGSALARLGDPVGHPLRAVLEDLAVVEIADSGGWAEDVDTEADLDRARRRVEGDADAGGRGTLR